MSHGHSHGPEESVPTGPAGQADANIDLSAIIALEQSAALNNDTKTYIKTILQGNSGVLRSDSDIDQQIILIIPMREAVKLKALRLYANDAAVDDTQSAPKTIKIFCNKPNLTFSDVDDEKACQEFVLTAAHTGAAAELPLKLIRFNNLHTLTIYISDNQGDTPVTFINKIELIGVPIAGMNAANIKKIE